MDAVEWAVRAQKLGAGEILLTSMDADGTKDGYDLELTDAVARNVNIPVIASGGCGNVEHIYEVLDQDQGGGGIGGLDIPLQRAHRRPGQVVPAQAGGAGQMTDIKFNSEGLIPVIVQDAYTNEVLMLAYANQDAYDLMLSTGYTHFWSRSRQKLWKKGETSGHLQKIVSMQLDCDADTLLVRVEQEGVACHLDRASCFEEVLYGDLAGTMNIIPELKRVDRRAQAGTESGFIHKQAAGR